MTTDSDHSERRDYYRLEDKIHLVRSVLEPHMISDDPYHERYSIPRETLLLSQLRALDADYHSLVRQLADGHQALFAVLTAFDRKIDLLAKYITNKGADDSSLVREWVELSERGLSFRSSQPIAAGTFLHLTLVLFPSSTVVATIAEAKSCAQIEQGPAIYRIGCEFSVLLEADRKQLSRHLLRRQAGKRKDSGY
jgi:hypothetical protein